MKRREPVVAGLLNFFLPGLGFVYVGTGVLQIAGTLLFLTGLVETLLLFQGPSALTTPQLLIGLIEAGTLGIAAAGAAMLANATLPAALKCSFCDSEVAPAAKFCPGCGKALAQSSTAKAS